MTDDSQLKEARNRAQTRADEIQRFILDGDANLASLLVKAYRRGLPEDRCLEAFRALEQCIAEARATFTAAITQPEPRLMAKQRVVL